MNIHVIYRKDEVLKLLKLIPIRHSEKIAKRNLIFKVSKERLINFEDVKDDIKRLNDKIEESVKTKILNKLNLS